jgi:hypothetical protein
MIDRSGRQILSEDVTVEVNFSEGRVPISVFGRTGYVDRRGRVLIFPQFEWGKSFTEGLAAVQKDSLWGPIDSTATYVVRTFIPMPLPASPVVICL